MGSVSPVQVAGKPFGGDGAPLFLIAGPCVIEDEPMARRIARFLADLCARLAVPFIFKASYDKANRTAADSFRGPGLREGLRILAAAREEARVPVLSDVHAVDEVAPAAAALDVLQVPAFLCRQTDLVSAVARSGKCVNIKKGQFLAPWDMGAVARKARDAGAADLMLTDRGVSFGYNTLVSDMRALPILRRFGCPVVFDATHSVQQPGGLGNASGGEREFVPTLARAAVAAGCDGLFMEVHEDPTRAKSDGPTMLRLDQVEPLLRQAVEIHRVVQQAAR